jgi:hypothetical protein
MISKVTAQIHEMVQPSVASLSEQLTILAQRLAGLLDPIHQVTIHQVTMALAGPAGGEHGVTGDDAVLKKGTNHGPPPSRGSGPRSAVQGQEVRADAANRATGPLTAAARSWRAHTIIASQGGRTDHAGTRTAPRARSLLPRLPAFRQTPIGRSAGNGTVEQQIQFSSLAGLAGKMQQEAAQQVGDRQHLIAQLEANGHLSALASAAAGAGLRVQVVGGQTARW